jgi:hypothetical protein
MAATISELLDRVDNAPDILDAIPELERCVSWKRVGSCKVRGDRATFVYQEGNREGTYESPWVGTCHFNRTTPDQQILQVLVVVSTGIYGWEILTEDPEADNWKFPGWPPVSASMVNRATWGRVWTFLQDVASDPDRKRGAGWVSVSARVSDRAGTE